MSKKLLFLIALIVLGGLALAACAGPAGALGPQGPAGPQGPEGPEGPPGASLTITETKALETAGNLAAIQFPALDEVRRGCPACHALVNPETGQFTLPYEAHERAEARGGEHPEAAPDGTSLAVTEEVNVTTCLQCHASGTGDREGMGVVAPLALRDIVHPAHMNSQFFKLHYGGNCFTCHNVSGEGEWELLSEKVEVNEKGVPNPEALPIPGAVPIGEVTGGQTASSGSIARGGRLYDNWIEEAGVEEPAADNPLWASQTTNTRSGIDTWRCKECHGWDYLGAAGAYGTGSHFTGFPGVTGAASKTSDDLTAMISGDTDPNHDFSAMGDEAIADLVTFLQSGLIDVTPLINADTKSAIGGDTAHGEELFASCTACHGEDGRTLNFGSAEEPEYVGTIALDNPWEFLHKVRAGQPGTNMPAAIDNNWSTDDLVDILAFSQSLPVEAPYVSSKIRNEGRRNAMSMKQRALHLVLPCLVGLALVSLLAACGGQQATQAPTEPSLATEVMTEAPAATEPPTAVPTEPPTEAPVETAAATATETFAAPEDALVSVKVEQAPELDGAADEAAWNDATEIVIPVSGGANNGSTEVSLKSVYTSDMVYFLVTWADPTESWLRSPWEKQADGTWTKLSDPNDKGGDNSLYYEDKLAFIWDIDNSIPDFDKIGCFAACHAGENSDVKPYGNMYTNEEGQLGDIWHWKTVRNLNQADDQYVDWTRYSADTPGAGRKSDASDSGGYVNNETEDQKLPAFMPPDGGNKDGSPGYILDSEKVPFDDGLFEAGDRVPGIIKSEFVGDRGDISAGWKYNDGKWTLEIGRALDTGSETDVQFTDLAATYHFGIATFDNTSVRHAFQNGATPFVFRP